MIKSVSIFVASLSALVITCAIALVSAPPAAAQTAKNLKCNGCVSSKDIKNKSIRSNDIRNNAVKGAKVKNGSLTAVDLGDEAGVDFVGGSNTLDLLLTTDTVVQSVTVSAPRSGFVILIASGTFIFTQTNALVACSLTTGSTIEGLDNQQASNNGSPHAQFFGMTEGFLVPPGSTTLRLICRELSEGVGTFNTDLTAIYAPTQY